MPLRRLRRLHPAEIADIVESASHEEGEEIIHAVHADPELEADVFVLDAEGRLMGAVSLPSLVQAEPGAAVSTLVERGDTALASADDLPEVARMLTDFNLSIAPVVDEERRLIGVVSVDDVLEAMLPDSWRRRAEAEPG